jgi:hypothetical protein
MEICNQWGRVSRKGEWRVGEWRHPRINGGIPLAMTHTLGIWRLGKLSPVAREEPYWSNRDTNDPYNFDPVYKTFREWGWSRD